HGHARVEVTDHVLDPGGHEIVGDRYALARVADVVAHTDADLLAEDAAGVVDVGNRLLGALLQLCSKGGVRAGDGSADAELDRVVLLTAAGKRESKAAHSGKRGERLHRSLPLNRQPATGNEQDSSRKRGKCHPNSATQGSVLSPPIERTSAPIDPAVRCDHLLHPLKPKAQ